MATIAVLPLARSTFDVPYAESRWAALKARLIASGHRILGGEALLFDAPAAEAALAKLDGARPDLLLLVQVTFTDASMTVRIAQKGLAPFAIWAFPEPRAGGRLRLNAFCGLNLAAHALGRAGREFAWIYADPETADVPALLVDAMGGQKTTLGKRPSPPAPNAGDLAAADEVLGRLKGARIGLVGQHPDGFDTCRYEPAALRALAGVEVTGMTLADVFARARAVPGEAILARRAEVARKLDGLNAVDQDQLARSLSVYEALKGLAHEGGCAAMAVRCWPEMFTEYGCAACGPMAMLNGEKIPAACEADVYGALTALALQEVAGAPSWLVDVVDMDRASDTAVIWHCGLAPLDMCDPEARPEAQIHSNRRMPLLHQFPLKPGRVTVARISQARNAPKMILAGAEVLRAPPSFTGTSGVLRFDAAMAEVLPRLIEERLEHHVAIAYGEHRGAMRALASRMGLPIVELA